MFHAAGRERRAIAPCEERYDSVNPFDIALAQPSDGRGWVVWLETHVDRAAQYESRCEVSLGPTPGPGLPPQETCWCSTEVLRDDTTATLHVARVDFSSATIDEAFKMPIAPSLYGTTADGFEKTPVVDAQAFGDQLAIGLRLRGALQSGLWTVTYQLMQLDTSQL